MSPWRRWPTDGPGPRPRAVLAGAGLLGLAAVAFALFTRTPDRILAPLPRVQPDPPPPGALGASHLAVPVRIELAALLEELDGAVPRSYGDLEERREISDRTDVAFELERSPFRAGIDGGTASLGAVVHYRGRAWYDPPVLPEVSASCGTDDDEEPPRLAVALEAPIAIDRDWRLRIRSRVARVEPVSEADRDRCRITPLRIDVTGRVLEAAQGLLADHTADVDSAAAGVDLRSRFEEWWGILRDPIELADSVWLVLDPREVRRGPIVGRGQEVEVTVGLTAYPRVVVGYRPELAPVALPPLDTGWVEPGLEILVEARAGYPAASDILNDALAGEVLEYRGRRLTVESVAVSGVGGGKLALAVELRGDLDARVFLVGTPVVDPASGRVSVPDLAFDVATSNLLVAGASWLGRTGLEDLLRRRASWPAAPAVDWLAGKLHEGLNRSLSDETRLEGSVEGVRILGVQARREALLVRAAARAGARFVVADDADGRGAERPHAGATDETRRPPEA